MAKEVRTRGGAIVPLGCQPPTCLEPFLTTTYNLGAGRGLRSLSPHSYQDNTPVTGFSLIQWAPQLSLHAAPDFPHQPCSFLLLSWVAFWLKAIS